MKKMLLTVTLGALALGCTAAQAEPWIKLLDRNLSQFDIYLSYRGADMASVIANTAPADLLPLGLNPAGQDVFSVIEEHGRPVLKITGEIYGAVATRREFENFDFIARVKWGEKKWPPRLDKERDSGVLYFSSGEPGVDHWHSWMLSQEFQVAEGHMGDYWSIAGSQIDIRSLVPAGDATHIFSADAPPVAYDRVLNYCRASENPEIAHDWNTLRLICFNNQCLHIVNGRVMMALSNSRFTRDGASVPLSRGRIQIQSEAAEVYYKDMRIRAISAMPAKYARYFRTGG